MRLLPVILGLLLALPAFAQQNWMVGRWFGYGQPHDKSEMWLEEARPNGRIHILHRACFQGKAADVTHDGSWSLKGDILTVRIEKVNGQAVPVVQNDVYRIQSHTQNRQTYRLERTGFVYSSRKVDGKFQMPPCDLAS